jgi:hypothetical protein
MRIKCTKLNVEFHKALKMLAIKKGKTLSKLSPSDINSNFNYSLKKPEKSEFEPRQKKRFEFRI